jgi:transformation/transcription domain-associated protein
MQVLTLRQALFFPMRTANEEYMMMKRRSANDASRTSGNIRAPDVANAEGVSPNTNEGEPKLGQPNSTPQVTEPVSRAPWDYMEEIVSMVKTAFPLLILSLETMVDQFTSRFKTSPEEDAYRLSGILLQEISQVPRLLYTIFHALTHVISNTLFAQALRMTLKESRRRARQISIGWPSV